MNNEQECEIKGLKSGKKVFLLTILICVLVPLVGVVIALGLSGDLKGVSDGSEWKNEPLVWGEQNRWEVMKVNPTEIVQKPGPRPPFEGRVRKNLDFEISPKELAVIEQVKAENARGENFGAMLDKLEGISAAGDMFYINYLAGRTAERRGEHAQGRERLAKAFAGAEKVLRVRFVDDAGIPQKSQDVGTVRVICVQKRDGIINEDVELIFPNEKTDENGYIYLPVYDSVLRLSQTPQGMKPKLAKKNVGEAASSESEKIYFEVPGRVGELDEIVVRKQPKQQ